MLSLSSPIENFSKITKPQIAALKKLGINTAQDLLLHFPYRYLDFSQTKQIKDLVQGENVSLKVKIKSISSRFSFRGRMSLAEAVVSDETGSLKVVWFNQPYLANSLHSGEEMFLAGTPEYYNFTLQLTNPIYEKSSDFPIHTSRLVPMYHLKDGIYPKTFRNLVAQVLPLVDDVADTLPAEVLANEQLLTIKQTVNFSHFPESLEQVENAKKRLAFEEIFFSQLLAQKHKMELAKKQAFAVKFDQSLTKNFLAKLPFSLTPQQKKAAWEILQDLEKTMPMNRLLEGDVGSGKTLVALMAALQVIDKNYQAVFLAPTEILANQHFLTASKYLKNRVCLVTGHYSKIGTDDVPKAKLQALIKEGMPGLFIGTHALLQAKVKFKKLALVIIDEQHRWGVEQRAQLMKTAKKVPHLLSLSATPIPRTLQLAFYGELDISRITAKPKNRKPIITKLVDVENRQKAYDFIKKQIALGRQAFVITPLVNENDKLGVKAAVSEAETLQKVFFGLKIALLHGKMSAKDKEQVMGDFLANRTQILVATSVVEVGVDVPNASVMIIEGAERFGLAQLHQFRGRVGRAEHQSYCFLFMSPPRAGLNQNSQILIDEKNQLTKTRLEEFAKTQDGFELAELDLKQRGFGELYGATQSGWNFKYFDPSYTALIQPARNEAIKILKDNLELTNYPLLKEKIKDKVIHFE